MALSLSLSLIFRSGFTLMLIIVSLYIANTLHMLKAHVRTLWA